MLHLDTWQNVHIEPFSTEVSVVNVNNVNGSKWLCSIENQRIEKKRKRKNKFTYMYTEQPQHYDHLPNIE